MKPRPNFPRAVRATACVGNYALAMAALREARRTAPTRTLRRIIDNLLHHARGVTPLVRKTARQLALNFGKGGTSS